MAPKCDKKKSAAGKKCQICLRDTDSVRLLGPFMTSDTIAAHFYCVVSIYDLSFRTLQFDVSEFIKLYE